jgi:hypothetical protein
MIRVKVELWMWLGKELGGDFQSPSEMRSVTEMEVERGTGMQDLFEHLAHRHPAIAQKIYNPQTKKFYPNLSVIVTDKHDLIRPFGSETSVLNDGDRIKVLPIYAGG